MSKIPIQDLKSLFQTGDTVTESSMVDLIDTLDDLPITPGSAGQVLTTDGTNAAWEDIPKELPAQSSTTNGQFLMSNGTTTSWQAPDSQLTDFYFEAVPVVDGSIESISDLTMKVGSGIQVDGMPFYGTVWYIIYNTTAVTYSWSRITYNYTSQAYHQPVAHQSDTSKHIGIAVVANDNDPQSGDPFDDVLNPDLIWFSGWRNVVTELVPLPEASNANQVLTVDSAGVNYGWEDIPENPQRLSLSAAINESVWGNSKSYVLKSYAYLMVNTAEQLPSNLIAYTVTYSELTATYYWTELTWNTSQMVYSGYTALSSIPDDLKYQYNVMVIVFDPSTGIVTSGSPFSTNKMPYYYWYSEQVPLLRELFPMATNADNNKVLTTTINSSAIPDITWQPLPTIPPEFDIHYSRDSTLMPAIITPIELSVLGGDTVPNASNTPYLVVLGTDGIMTWYPSTSQSDPTNPNAWAWDDLSFAPGDQTTVVVSNHGDLSVADTDPYSRGNAEYVNWIQDTWQSVHILQDQPVTSDSGFIQNRATLTTPIQIAMGSVTFEIDRVVPGTGNYGSFTVSAMTSAAAGGSFFLTKYPGAAQTFPPSIDGDLSIGTMSQIMAQIDINTYGYRVEVLVEDLTSRDSEM